MAPCLPWGFIADASLLSFAGPRIPCHHEMLLRCRPGLYITGLPTKPDHPYSIITRWLLQSYRCSAACDCRRIIVSSQIVCLFCKRPEVLNGRPQDQPTSSTDTMPMLKVTIRYRRPFPPCRHQVNSCKSTPSKIRHAGQSSPRHDRVTSYS